MYIFAFTMNLLSLNSVKVREKRIISWFFHLQLCLGLEQTIYREKQILSKGK